MIDHGANVNAREPERHKTPLHYATEEDKVEIVQKLVASGANVHALTADGKKPLELARKWKPNYHVIADILRQEERRTKITDQ